MSAARMKTAIRDHESVSKRSCVRAILSHSAFVKISGAHLGRLVAELADLWVVGRESVPVILAHLRLQIPHAAPGGAMYGIDRSTITRAVHEVRLLLSGRGFTAPTGVRLSALADVVAYAADEDVTLCLDGSEIQARRRKPNRPGRLGRMHNQTAARTEGIDALLDQFPTCGSRQTTPTAGYVAPVPIRVCLRSLVRRVAGQRAFRTGSKSPSPPKIPAKRHRRTHRHLERDPQDPAPGPYLHRTRHRRFWQPGS